MKFPPRLVLGGFLGLSAISCGILLGIPDEDALEVVPVEAGVDGVTPSVDGGPGAGRCSLGQTLPAKAGNAPVGDARTFLSALRTASFGGRRAVPTGFDLDGVCTCDPADDSTHRAQPSCTEPKDASRPGACDPVKGIDDGFSLTLIDMTAGLESAFFLREDPCRKRTLVVGVSNYNGLASDDEVSVAVVETFDLRTIEDAGVCPDTTDSAWFNAKDRWRVSRKSTDQTGALTPSYPGYVRDFQLVVDRRAAGDTVPLLIGATTVPVAGFVLQGRLVPTNNNGNDIRVINGVIQSDGGTANFFRLADAVLAGRATTTAFLGKVGQVIVGGAPLCTLTNATPYGTIKNALCRAQDVAAQPSRDFTGTPCDALSIVLTFETASFGRLGVEAEAPVGVGCAEAFNDTCK